MRSHPLPEARFYADLMLTELRKVIPSFLQRVDRARAGRGVVGLLRRHPRTRPSGCSRRLWPDALPGEPTERLGGQRGEVRLVDFDPEGEDKLLAAICFAHLDVSEDEALRRVRALSADERIALLHAYVGRPQEPPTPPRAGLRAHRLPLRDRRRLRRLPGPPAPPAAHHRVAAARHPSSATTSPTSWSRPARRPPTSSPSSARRALLRRHGRPTSRLEAAYAVALALPHPLRHADERPRGACT